MPELYLDEAVLNIPQFQNNPLEFLRQQMIERLQAASALYQIPVSEDAAESALEEKEPILEEANQEKRMNNRRR